jgi:polyhydroxyalkanoate synthesis repressor PhaR
MCYIFVYSKQKTGGWILGQEIIIKKYSNRRLYDTNKSEYITINQVAEIIKEGEDVKVVDAKTNEDVTPYILAQIVLEQSKLNNILLPAPLLHVIIRFGDNILSDFFENHLLKTIENYLYQKKDFDDNFRKMLELSSDFTGMAQKTMTEMTPFKIFMDMLSPSSSKKEEKE